GASAVAHLDTPQPEWAHSGGTGLRRSLRRGRHSAHASSGGGHSVEGKEVPGGNH
ncbi:unnamed protein product, partial [Closterium sp. NIES-53]